MPYKEPTCTKCTIFAILLAITLQDALSAVVDPIVSLPQGKIKGKIEESRGGKNFVQYLGIPYVKKPERFQEAGPAPTWQDLRDGTKFGSQCHQFDRKTKSVVGNEDCLFLNVFTPVDVPKNAPTTTGTKTVSSTTSTTTATVTPKLRPVIFHIHGGSFVSQSGDLFGPQYLLDEDVILVTFNYRLGVLGFFSTGDKETTANLGLRDQIKALKWVKQNIHLFGGDPNRITLFGAGSAGGALASYLMISPLAQGLFFAVISTSGNALCPWAIVHNPGKIAVKLATKLNCLNTKSTFEITKCIKSKGIKDIELARLSLQGISEDPAVPFAPVVESWFAKDPSGHALEIAVPEDPLKLLSEGRFARVPWLTGVNSMNGVNLAVATIITTPKRLTQLDQEWQKLAPITFHYSQTSSNPSNASDAIREHYFGTKNITFDTKDKLISALTDRNFISCTAKAASIQSKFSPVYLYHLGYLGAASFQDGWGLKDKLNVNGVVFGDELQHIFKSNSGFFPYIKKGDKHYPFSEKMIKLWTSFAQNGKPMEQTEKAGAEWSPVPSNTPMAQLQWYNLDGSPMSRQIVFDGTKQAALWEQLDLYAYNPPVTNGINGPGKFTIGYEMNKGQKGAPGVPLPVSAIAPGAALKSPALVAALASTPKPNQPMPIGVSYGITPAVYPVQGTTTSTTPKSSVSASVPSTSKPLVTPGPSTVEVTPSHIGSAILKEDYSSTTTTTTKKPGFFSKILG